MCKLCNGTGGMSFQTTFGLQFEPCPNDSCEEDRIKARNESIARVDAYFASLEKSESA